MDDDGGNGNESGPRRTRQADPVAIREAARRKAKERLEREAGSTGSGGAKKTTKTSSQKQARMTTGADLPEQQVPGGVGGTSDRTGLGVAGRSIVPDTSVVVDGRITILVEAGELSGSEVIVPQAVVAELEAQANRGMDAGFTGLDELVALQSLRERGEIKLRYTGIRPSLQDIQLARGGEIDAQIRSVARDEDAVLVTSDKVQSQVCAAEGIDYRYLRPAKEAARVGELQVLRYLKDDVMSVHLKQDQPPFIKRGQPGSMRYERLPDPPLDKRLLSDMAREVVEAARRDDRSFVEIERRGATVVQLRDMRIAISRPPFSEAMEITIVRPIVKLDIEEYGLPDEVLGRLTETTRGILVSGPPGSGKSTFAQAIAEHLFTLGTVVKTMESPRDLQLGGEITQYAPLEKDISLTGDFLLLVRPDFVIYDEVRKTKDFEVFADMRLAGVGLIGVTHSNRAIDAVQRLIGRVELGMIPQIVDTVVHIAGGKIEQILEMEFTVRVPAGMKEQDLARPVIRVRDFQTKKDLFEMYTYGEQIVVMPLEKVHKKASGVERLATGRLNDILRRRIEGPFEVEVDGDRATIWVEEWEIASVIGRGGSRVQDLEAKTGLKLDVKTFPEQGRKRGQLTRKSVASEWAEEEGLHQAEGDGLIPQIRATKKQVVLTVGPEYGGQEAEVLVDGRPVAQGHLSNKGEIRFSRRGPEGKRVERAAKGVADVRVMLV
jgi:ATPase